MCSNAFQSKGGVFIFIDYCQKYDYTMNTT